MLQYSERQTSTYILHSLVYSRGIVENTAICSICTKHINIKMNIYTYEMLHQLGFQLCIKVLVRRGIRTPAYRSRLRPERSALDRSAILTYKILEKKLKILKILGLMEFGTNFKFNLQFSVLFSWIFERFIKRRFCICFFSFFSLFPQAQWNPMANKRLQGKKP